MEEDLCVDQQDLFYIDKEPAPNVLGRDNQHKTVMKGTAWIDSYEEELFIDLTTSNKFKSMQEFSDEKKVSGLEFNKRLRRRYQITNPIPEWLKNIKENKHTIVKETELFSENTYVQNKQKKAIKVSPDVIDIKKISSTLYEGRKYSPTIVDFHKNGEFMLIANSRVLRLYSIREQNNVLVQSVGLEKFQISDAKFTHDGKEIIVCGGKRVYYVYNLENQSFERIYSDSNVNSISLSQDNKFLAFGSGCGYANIVSNNSKGVVASINMNDDEKGISFLEDNSILSMDGSQTIYRWESKNSFMCSGKFVNVNAVDGTCMAVSMNEKLVSCGTSSGLVDIYNMEGGLEKMTHIKSLENLTTNINKIEFDNTSQILAIGSCESNNAIRLVNTKSWRVYPNWPSNSRLGVVDTFRISKNSRYFALGTGKKYISLFNFCHFNKCNN